MRSRSGPEIHSGDEAFAIENLRLAHRSACTSPASRPDGDRFASRRGRCRGSNGNHRRAAKLGPSNAPFLRNVKEISWNVRGGASGLYFCDAPVVRGPNVRGFTTKESLLATPRSPSPSRSMTRSQSSGKWSRSLNSTLVVFFPTVLPTNTGFLIQGPYPTTPSRDNVPPKESMEQASGA